MDDLMVKQIRVELLVGIITLLWAVLSVTSSQPILLDHLTGVMPSTYWSFSGFIIGGAQIYISRNHALLNTNAHWAVAFVSAIFWGYLGAAASYAHAGTIPILIFWATMAATIWELANVRS